jgi:histidinol-phosphate phosphatase family protein
MNNRPQQAVVLADGRGAQFGALTNATPEAMIEMHGRPFLEYVVGLLRQQGFTDLVLLLGYLPHVVQNYFGDGRRLGVRITYATTGGETATAADLRQIGELREHFLLVQGHTYWPMQFDLLWAQYCAGRGTGLATVYCNRDAYSRDTVAIDPQGFIEAFDCAGKKEGLRGVAVGYTILRRDALDPPLARDAAIDAALFPLLAERRQLAAHLTEHRYYSVAVPERLSLAEIFLARKPAVILDRDGVLNRKPPPGQYVRSVAEFEWLPGALEALRAFRQAGYSVIVASNQSGLARGQVSVEALEAIHETMRAQARAAGGAIDAIYHCPHDWYAGCDCRKPRPGLLFQAQRDFSLDLTRTYFLGDDERDMEAAAAGGATGRLVTPQQPLLAHARELVRDAAAVNS